ncbi:MAG: UDP-N-acetylmuramoyl-tripeptide--D-alanyl-D-alanine ligase [Desulfomonile tiedjei]|nr:UDP-N-acetylmuramoyl-tripeptide--D-alanyl-D-alanine ligase [Desulfomonile tiedjei]
MRAEGGPFQADAIARACEGTVMSGDPSAMFPAICTDSREIKEGDLFVPLKGLSYDGHDFLFPALEAGARGSLVNRDAHRDIPQFLANSVLIQVQDTLQALSTLASAHRILYPTPLIAVTGSSGKTTVKEMIAAILRRSHRPLVSEGNFNNLIGLPMTVLNLRPEHDVAVVEAGINVVGEMDSLARAARPDVAVITTVGPVHLEGLGTTETVAAEKFKLVRGLAATGTAVVPEDNPFIEPLLQDCSCRVVRFGIDTGDYRAAAVNGRDGTTFQMITPSGSRTIKLQCPGRHNIANSLAAAAAAMAVGATIEEVGEALDRFTAPRWRMEVLGLSGNRKLIRDCYNANPLSVKAALEVLAKAGTGARLAVLADMAELGARSEALHREIGKEAARLGIERLIYVGSFGRAVHEGFVAGGGNERAVTLAEDKDTAWHAIAPVVRDFDAILVKGSRMMRMEILADRIVEEN